MPESGESEYVRAHNARYEAAWEEEGLKWDALMERDYHGKLMVYCNPNSPRGKRIRALQAAERRDKKLGALGKTQRFRILKRDNYRCQLCGATAGDGPHIRLHVDHKIARTHGGTNDDENLWSLCQDCNLGKRTQAL